VIENKKIAIFESPTGTGKSLSLTCGALTWLKQHESLLRQELTARIAQLQIEGADTKPSSESDWISEEYEKLQKKDSLNHFKVLAKKIEEQERKLKEIRRRYVEGQKAQTGSRFATVKKDTVELFEKPVAQFADDEFDLKEPEDDADDEPFESSIDKDKFQDVKVRSSAIQRTGNFSTPRRSFSAAAHTPS
jgi:chromosome transmission fidelity protein 1